MANPTSRQIEFGCKHFNGIQHDHCRAGIAYQQFLYRNYDKFPCHPKPDGHLTGACASFEFMTEAEVDQRDHDTDEAVKKWATAILSDVCPHCGESTEPKEQIGRCVYGACGCRLYQGKLSASASVSTRDGNETDLE